MAKVGEGEIVNVIFPFFKLIILKCYWLEFVHQDLHRQRFFLEIGFVLIFVLCSINPVWAPLREKIALRLRFLFFLGSQF